MRTLSQEKVWTITNDELIGSFRKCQLRKDPGVVVKDYMELALKIAALQFHNQNFLLLFRGQSKDHKLGKNGGTTIRPSIFRRSPEYKTSTWRDTLVDRYSRLKNAEALLVEKWHLNEGKRKLLRSAAIKWAILQHYEVCETPLLDVTHSLRIAASFASLKNDTNEAYIMVFAIPQISGAVTSCSYHEIQTLRLSSLCPPSATRPHLQEGYLIGEYPELQSFDQKANIKAYETDFGQRMIGKFKFNPKEFWLESTNFPQISYDALYPDESDKLHAVCQKVREDLDKPT